MDPSTAGGSSHPRGEEARSARGSSTPTCPREVAGSVPPWSCWRGRKPPGSLSAMAGDVLRR